jgi:4-hydroxy-3-polyprenylbenzoate decarboxylase
VNITADADVIGKVQGLLESGDIDSVFKLVIAVDHTVDPSDIHTVAWQLLGNSDPQRDHRYFSNGALLLDGTIKAFRKGGFPRKWPNVVCSDQDTISAVDKKWDSMGAGDLIKSPSCKYRSLLGKGKDELFYS